MINRFLLVVLFTSLFSGPLGCADAGSTMLRATVATSALVSSGYRLVGEYDKQKQADIIAHVHDAPPAVTEANFNAYRAQRDKVLKGLDIASQTIEDAYKEIPAINDAIDAAKKKQLTDLALKLFKIGIDVSAELQKFGVKIDASLLKTITGGAS